MSKKKAETKPLNKWKISPYATKAWEIRQLKQDIDTGELSYGNPSYPGNLEAAATHLLGLVLRSEEFTGTPASIAVFADRIVQAYEKATKQVIEGLRPFDLGERSTAVLDLSGNGHESKPIILNDGILRDSVYETGQVIQNQLYMCHPVTNVEMTAAVYDWIVKNWYDYCYSGLDPAFDGVHGPRLKIKPDDLERMNEDIKTYKRFALHGQFYLFEVLDLEKGVMTSEK